jgi:hypothetical protein
MSKVNIPICKLSDEECNTLFNSVIDKLNIRNPKFFYPIYKKVIDEENELSEELKKIVLDSKFKCKEILEKLYDSDEGEFETESENSDIDNTTDENTADEIINSGSSSGSEDNIQNINDILVQNDDVPIEEDDESGDEYNDDELEDAVSNTYLANAIIERTNKATGEKVLKDETIHIKKSALLDPIKVMKDEFIIPSKVTNMDIEDDSIKNTTAKLNSYNNSGHVESFFLYLGSKLVESGKCPTFPYYYGCINGEDPNYHHNISDEYESIARTKWFKDRINTDFDLLIIENDDVDEYQNKILSNIKKSNSSNGSGILVNNNDISNTLSEDDESDEEEEDESDEDDEEDESKKVEIETAEQEQEKEQVNNDIDIINISCDDTTNIKINTDFIKQIDDLDLELNDEFEQDGGNLNSEDSNENGNENSNENGIENGNENSNDLDIEELSDVDCDNLSFGDFECNGSSNYFLHCKDMPVSLSLMEKLDNTLDNLLDEEYNMSETEWFGVFFQIAFGLAIAQKYFNFVHNDLHASNIMFKATGIKYLYFQINNNYYKIPTYGKITKIIDFARGTFKFADRWIFSDQFKEDGDAFGQYDYPIDGTLKNCENKPNPSFDLVRLGTTIIARLENLPVVREFVEDITLDDDGNNLCYDDDTFQLYIDIAHNCHNAVPIEVLSRPVFEKFKINKNKIPTGVFIYKY